MLAFLAAAAAALLHSGGPGWLASPIHRYSAIYEAQFADMASAAALASVAEAGLDVAFGHFAEVPDETLVYIRYAGVGLAVAYSLCAGVAGCSLANQTLNLDVAAVAAVLDGNLTRWLDPRLVALNPWLADEPYATDIGVSREIVLIGTAATSATNQAVLSNLQRHGRGTSLAALLPAGRSLMESDDAHVVSALASTRWSMGLVACLDDDWKDVVSFASIYSPHNGTAAIAPSLASLAACTLGEAEAALAGVNGWNLWASQSQDCYPLTATVSVVLPRNYHGCNCSKAGEAIRFVQWVLGDMTEGLLRYHMLPLAPLAPDLVSRRLYEVYCDGHSWLDSHIDEGHLPLALRLFVALIAMSLTIFLLACCALFFAWRHTNTVKAGQPLFLGITAFGLILVLASGGLSTLDHQGATINEAAPVGQPGRYPSLDAGCRGQLWLYFLGSSLSFGAIVAKLWRVFVVMINPTMRDIKMRSSSLLKYICVSVVFDVALLKPWTAVAPPFYRVMVFTAGADGIEHWHGSCDVLPTGAAPYAIVLLVKGVLVVLVGMYLCGRLRTVRSRYSEGKAVMFVLTSYLQATAVGILIGWTIYPFSEAGSAVGFVLLRWCMTLMYCTTICIFVFGARLVILWQEQRKSPSNIALTVIKPTVGSTSAARHPSATASSPSRRLSLRIKPLGRSASIGIVPQEPGSTSSRSESTSQPVSTEPPCSDPFFSSV
jgi:ABC-type phosphate transport system substrate-binding protein